MWLDETFFVSLRPANVYYLHSGCYQCPQSNHYIYIHHMFSFIPSLARNFILLNHKTVKLLTVIICHLVDIHLHHMYIAPVRVQ